MKILILTTLLFSVFFASRVQCVQDEDNSGNAVDQEQGKKNVVDQIQAKAMDVLDAMPAKAIEMLSELGPMSDQTLEIMSNAFEKTADIIDPYLKKIDAIRPGLATKAKIVIDAMPGKVMEILGELGPMSDKTSDMMDKALDQSKFIIEKTAIVIEPYIKKIDEIQPGALEMVENIRSKTFDALEKIKEYIRKDKDEL